MSTADGTISFTKTPLASGCAADADVIVTVIAIG